MAKKPAHRKADDTLLPEIKYKLIDIQEGDFKGKIVDANNPFKCWLTVEQIGEQLNAIRAEAVLFCSERGIEVDPFNVVFPDPKKVPDGVMDALDLLESLCYADPSVLDRRSAGVLAAAMRAMWLYSRLPLAAKEPDYVRGRVNIKTLRTNATNAHKKSPAAKAAKEYGRKHLGWRRQGRAVSHLLEELATKHSKPHHKVTVAAIKKQLQRHPELLKPAR